MFDAKVALTKILMILKYVHMATLHNDNDWVMCHPRVHADNGSLDDH